MSSSNKNLFFETRDKFLKFFKERGHAIVSSSSLIPDDPSVLLTTAGMQQFKRYYTGELNPLSDFSSARTASIQKCFRTSDIEEVGDATHLTFFEMLGNFSFGPVVNDNAQDISGKGGYFKKAAIIWAYEFLTEVLGIAPHRIHVTIFAGDEETPRDNESYAIWSDIIGISKKCILDGDRKDNFWGPTGIEGPCGPTTEIYIDGVEVWNIVFNEFYKNSDGSYKPLSCAGIDTGMGYERLLCMLEGVSSIYETSAFVPIISTINECAPHLSDRDARIVADHVRASVFLISDGVEPSNKGVGYILRRLLRRLIVVGLKNDVHSDLFVSGFSAVRKMFGEFYPTILDEQRIISVWQDERIKFEEGIARGIKKIEELVVAGSQLSGALAFDLYQSYGLPKELTVELVKKKSPLFNDEYERREKEHQEISRAGAEKKFGGHGLVLDTGELKAETHKEAQKVVRMHTATHLLQAALRSVVDQRIHQMGSDINSERLRFDFSFDRKLTSDEISAVEALVNRYIERDYPVYFVHMRKEEALESGALSFFRQKYPDEVRVYSIGSAESRELISSEICGGPHVDHTGEIGKFSIIKEEAVSKGVRRIRAIIE